MARPALYPCGTAQAIKRHNYHGEPLCKKCAKWQKDNIRPRAKVAECGTRSGYARHRREPDYNGRVECEPCRKANSDWQLTYVNGMGLNNVQRMQLWVLLNPEKYKAYHREYYHTVRKPLLEAAKAKAAK